MLVIRKYRWTENPDTKGDAPGGHVAPLPSELMTPCPSGAMHFTSWNQKPEPWEWTIRDDSLSLAVHPYISVFVPRSRIERFVISFVADNVFTLWGYGTFSLPTRVPLPRHDRAKTIEEPIRCPGTLPGLAPQHMEIGSVMGNFSRQSIVDSLERLGYPVEQIPWGEFLTRCS